MNHPVLDQATAHGGESPLEYLAFRLGREEYGIDIQAVREIRNYEEVTRLANAPAHVKGVINLRGVIVPIIELRMRFTQQSLTQGQATVVIIVGVAERTVGLIVDGVNDVVEAAALDIRPAPAFGDKGTSDDIVGLGSLGDRMLILLDVPNCLTKLDAGKRASAALAIAA